MKMIRSIVQGLLGLAVMANTAVGGGTETIVDIALADPRFSTLVTAVTAAGLVDTLSGPGPFSK